MPRYYLVTLYYGMKQRCYNHNFPGYKNYGGRGITVHASWSSTEIFIKWIQANIGERPTTKHSIDRIDNDGNYEPGNVRWATRKEQASNKRPRSVWNYPKHINYTPHYRCYVTYQGRRMPQSECAKLLGLTKATITMIKNGKIKNHRGLIFG